MNLNRSFLCEDANRSEQLHTAIGASVANVYYVLREQLIPHLKKYRTNGYPACISVLGVAEEDLVVASMFKCWLLSAEWVATEERVKYYGVSCASPDRVVKHLRIAEVRRKE